MHSTMLMLGALLSFTGISSAATVWIENTNPPANMYVTHCTLQIVGDLFGCKDASSEPFDKGCGGNKGVETKRICNTAAVEIDWDTLQVRFSNNPGDHATCTLDKGTSGGHCDM